MHTYRPASLCCLTQSQRHRLVVDVTNKTFAVSLKPGVHQQQHRSNIVECNEVECCFDKVESSLDNVAVFGNKVEAMFDFVACCFDNVASTFLLLWTGL